MPSPLDVEQKFRNLTYLLSYPSTSIHRLRLIADFFRFLGSDTAMYESYVLELVERLPGIVGDVKPGGNDPAQLEIVYGALRSACGAVPVAETLPGIGRVLEVLHERIVASALFVGDIARAVALLEGPRTSADRPWLERILARGGTREALLLAAREESRASDPDIAIRLEHHLEEWEEITTLPPGSAYFPAVETAYSGEQDGEEYGILRTARVHITGLSKEAGDHIHTDVAFFGVEPVLTSLTRTPMRAARALFQATLPRAKAPHVSAHIHLHPQSALHEGNSANLAVAALFYTALLDETQQRIRYRIRPTVAITGDVTDAGAVIPVDDDSLRVKLKAIFFSHIDAVVVPRAQIESANDLVLELQKQFPSRTLDIIGISHLREIFYDLRIIEQRIISPLAATTRFLWHHRIPAGLLIIVAILAITLGLHLYGPIDTNPVAADWSGELMLLKNSYGDIVEEVNVGHATATEGKNLLAAGSRKKLACFMDANADGINEIVYIRKGDPEHGENDQLVCTAVGRRQPFWTKSSNRKLDFPRKVDAKSGDFSFSFLWGGDLSADGSCDILLISNSLPSFPGLILAIDALSGHELSCYLNVGHINSLACADLNGDGVKEILACGANNAYRSAAMFVLDPRQLQGHSPTRGDYVPAGFSRGKEEAYMLIPRTIVGKQYARETSMNVAQFFEIAGGEKHFSITLDDVSVRIQPNAATIEAHIKYTFSNDFILLGIDTGDDFDLLAEQLTRDSSIARVPDRAYFESFADSITMWANGQFASISSLGKNALKRP